MRLMSSDTSTVHALMLDASSNDAEQVLNVLRNTGLAVRATQVVNDEELQDALNRQSWDIFLARDNCPQLPIFAALELINQSGRDIPVIEIGDDYTPEAVFASLDSGVQSYIPDDNEPLLCWAVTNELKHLEDRRKRKQAEAHLAETENRCELLLANSRDAIAYIHDGMHIYANHSYLELFGYTDWDDLECMPIMDMIDKEYRMDFKAFLRAQSHASDGSSFKFVGCKENGEKFDGFLSLSSASYDNEPCIQVLINIKADDAELQEKLLELSTVDSLTKLSNRERLTTQLTDLVNSAATGGTNGGLAYIELDQFDEWETTYGLKDSDQILVGVADWLRDSTSDEDIVARVSGHSFAILRKKTTTKELNNDCTKLIQSFSKMLFEANKQTVTGTISIGIAPINERSPDSAQVLHDAHAAAARAESGGGNKSCVFEYAVDGESASTDRETKESLRKIQESLESGRIHLLYQPIVKLHGEKQDFFQVLLRIKDEKDKAVPLNKVFPVTQGSPLALKLDYWVIAQSMRTLKEHRDKASRPTRFFIQLSATALDDDNLSQYILRSLKAARLPNEAIIFQIDETDATSRLKRVITLATTLSEAKIGLAINHFGSSLASENLLERLSASVMPFVKISGAVVQSELRDGATLKRLPELINQAKAANRQTIVPMIEEAQSLAQIWPLGIDYVQGFYLSPPMPNLHFDFDEAGL